MITRNIGERVLLITIGLLLMAAGMAAARSPQPNIILAMADDQGWGDMAYNGHPVLKTPNFDAMARAGLRLDRFYAAAPVCTPTRGSVMTGRHPNRFGCFKWGHALRPQEITIAEALKTAGYATGHFGKWHLGSVRRGSPVNPGASGFDEWFSAPNFYDNHAVMSDRGRAVPTKGESSMIAVDRALDFIRRRAKTDAPFLAVVWFGSPHGPHQALPQDLAPYAKEAKAKQHFYGEITGMDRAFGKLRDALGPLGIRDNTILWYCSDNGALKIGSSGGHRGKKGQVYEGGLLVPAIIEWPRMIPTPRVVTDRCNTSDIYPTLLEIAGVRMPDQPPLDGISLRRLIGGGAGDPGRSMGFWDYPVGGISTPSKTWMAELLAAQNNGHEPDDPARLRLDAGKITRHPAGDLRGHAAWVEGNWKLHRIAAKKNNVRLELYDLAADPAEKANLAQRHPERVEAMRTALETWQRSVAASLNGADYPSQ
ncbi:MAG: sulfatase-like hydrolase/transferase [Phycisphaerae bacterium]|nr:sulfatase-like hydrolase/transferase [Phycisphaerae bacterium]